MSRKMGRRADNHPKSHTLPSSPTHSHSSSSSDFEFTVSISPRNSSTADELFYKGQLLPLHLSPRLSMLRSLLLTHSSSSSSSADSSRPSTDSHSSFSADSSRPSSATDVDDNFHCLNPHHQNPQIKRPKYFSLSRFSSVFRAKDPKPRPNPETTPGSSSVKDVIRKYLKKVKPLYEKISISPKQRNSNSIINSINLSLIAKPDRSITGRSDFSLQNPRSENNNGSLSHSFSGSLRYPRKRSGVVSSCPSSMRSSPSHSGVLYQGGFSGRGPCYADASSMEELQSAIQGAIAHCKNSMGQDKKLISNEI